MLLDEWGEPSIVLKPFPNEHACRLQDPKKYDTCRRGERVAENPESVKGKKYYIIFCKKTGQSMEEQSYRYPKDSWTASQASAHCKYHKGKFEAAKEGGKTKEEAMDEVIRKTCEVEFKAEGEKDERIIEGYASTKDIDLVDDLVLPKAFDEAMPQYMKNPIMYFVHNWVAFPIGKIIGYEINRRGLRIKAKLSEAIDLADDVWALIKEGILKGLSVAFKILESEDIEEISKENPENKPKRIRKIKKIHLYEISVVGIPANPQALIDSAKSLGIELKSLNIVPDYRDEGANQRKYEMDEKEVKELKTDIEGLKTSVGDIKKGIESVDEAKKALADIQEAVKKTVTPADLKELQKKSQDDLLEATKKMHEEIEQKWVNPPKMEHDATSVGQAKRLGFTKDFDKSPIFKSAMIYENYEKASAFVGLINQKHLIKELQDASDDLMIIGAYMGLTEANAKGDLFWKRDPSGLKTYRRYKQLLDLTMKALDTQTATEGYEWLPTGMSAILQEGLELERGVIKRIPRFSQPTKSYPWPLLTSDCQAYIVDEAISDANANTITASTPGTSNITFTARSMGAGVWSSNEEIEDSIIAILPFLKKSLSRALINGEENAVINGDDSTTHQDTDVAALGASDIRKILDGFRYDALNTSGAKVDIVSTLTYAKLLLILKAAGKYAILPGKGFFIVSISGYYDILGLSEFTGYSNFFVNMVAATGKLTKGIGHDIVPSAYSREVLDPNGVNGGSDNIHNAIIFVNEDGFLIGDRRIYTVEQANYIWTQQKAVVATQRINMQKMVPSTDKPASIGYNNQN